MEKSCPAVLGTGEEQVLVNIDEKPSVQPHQPLRTREDVERSHRCPDPPARHVRGGGASGFRPAEPARRIFVVIARSYVFPARRLNHAGGVPEQTDSTPSSLTDGPRIELSPGSSPQTVVLE
jgi:hypothetical protein